MSKVRRGTPDASAWTARGARVSWIVRRFLAVLMLAGLLPVFQRESSVEAVLADLEPLSGRLNELRGEYAIPALSAGVIEIEERWTAGLGSTITPGQTPPTPLSIFHLASLTKTFASAVLLQLASEGKISLDDFVS